MMPSGTRSILVATLAVLAAAPVSQPARAQLLRYDGRPGESRGYARRQVDRVTQTVNGADRTMDLQSFWRFRATVREAGTEAIALTVVHDSIAVTGMPADSSPDFSALYGEPVDLVLDRRGEVRSITVPAGVERIERLDLDATYRTFFPTLPRGPATPGTAWADTLVLDTNQNGIDIRVERINRYELGTGGSAGGPVEVDYSITLSLEGHGRQQGAEVTLTGTGSGQGRFRFDPESGSYLGGEEESAIRMDAFVAAAGQNLLIPIVHRRTETVEAIE